MTRRRQGATKQTWHKVPQASPGDRKRMDALLAGDEPPAVRSVSPRVSPSARVERVRASNNIGLSKSFLSTLVKGLSGIQVFGTNTLPHLSADDFLRVTEELDRDPAEQIQRLHGVRKLCPDRLVGTIGKITLSDPSPSDPFYVVQAVLSTGLVRAIVSERNRLHDAVGAEAYGQHYPSSSIPILGTRDRIQGEELLSEVARVSTPDESMIFGLTQVIPTRP
jgi:hypothetical protein